MRKSVWLMIVIMMLALGLVGLAACKGGTEENADSAAAERGFFAEIWPEGDVTARLMNSAASDQIMEMNAEDTEAAAQLFQSLTEVKEDIFESVFPHRIEFSNGMNFEFDNENFNGYFDGKQYCGHLTKEEGDALMELVSHYTKAQPVEHPAYDLSGDPMTLYYRTDSGWQQMELRDRAAKRVEAVLNIEALEAANGGSFEVRYYLDFHNGTALTVYTDGTGTVSSGVDSDVYREWILEGDDPTVTFDAALYRTELPEGTSETIAQTMKNPEEVWE